MLSLLLSSCGSTSARKTAAALLLVVGKKSIWLVGRSVTPSLPHHRAEQPPKQTEGRSPAQAKRSIETIHAPLGGRAALPVRGDGRRRGLLAGRRGLAEGGQRSCHLALGLGGGAGHACLREGRRQEEGRRERLCGWCVYVIDRCEVACDIVGLAWANAGLVVPAHKRRRPSIAFFGPKICPRLDEPMKAAAASIGPTAMESDRNWIWFCKESNAGVPATS